MVLIIDFFKENFAGRGGGVARRGEEGLGGGGEGGVGGGGAELGGGGGRKLHILVYSYPRTIPRDKSRFVILCSVAPL